MTWWTTCKNFWQIGCQDPAVWQSLLGPILVFILLANVPNGPILFKPACPIVAQAYPNTQACPTHQQPMPSPAPLNFGLSSRRDSRTLLVLLIRLSHHYPCYYSPAFTYWLWLCSLLDCNPPPSHAGLSHIRPQSYCVERFNYSDRSIMILIANVRVRYYLTETATRCLDTPHLWWSLLFKWAYNLSLQIHNHVSTNESLSFLLVTWAGPPNESDRTIGVSETSSWPQTNGQPRLQPEEQKSGVFVAG